MANVKEDDCFMFFTIPSSLQHAGHQQPLVQRLHRTTPFPIAPADRIDILMAIAFELLVPRARAPAHLDETATLTTEHETDFFGANGMNRLSSSSPLLGAGKFVVVSCGCL
jgi:hypothetical protein